MRRLVIALALASALTPALLATTARAQAVADDIVKTLWCGEAFSVLFSLEKSDVDPSTKDLFDAFVTADGKLIEAGTQGYLDAGYTEEQVAKIKTDLVTEVTPIVSSEDQAGKYSPGDCNSVLHKVLVLPASASSAAPDGASVPASSASNDPSSSSGQ